MNKCVTDTIISVCEGARVVLPWTLPLPDGMENAGVWFRPENSTSLIVIMYSDPYKVDGISVDLNTRTIVIHEVRHEHEGRYIPHGLTSKYQAIVLKIKPANGSYTDVLFRPTDYILCYI